MSPRHFLTVMDLSGPELQGLLKEAAACKRDRARHQRLLAGRVVALVFQKPSMRTRVAFEVAVLHLGGSVVYLGQDDIQLGQREPIKDVARVLSRYVDAIVVRTFAHKDVEEFARYASVPVINGLSDLLHPCQALADVLTIQEQFGRTKGLRLGYVGDGNNNVLHSLVEACAMLGIHVSAATPKAYRPDAALWKAAVRVASSHGATMRWSEQPREAVRGAQVVYTDVWVSMGKEREATGRRKILRPYQVNGALLKTAAPGYRVLHCLPAHRGEEITDAVMESRHSVVIDQAENRLHVQKALLVMLLGRKKT